MNVQDLFEIIKYAGGISGAIISIGALLGVISKKPKIWIGNIAKESLKEDMLEVKDLLGEIKEQLNKDKESTLAALRHSITLIYETYLPQKSIPSNVKKDLCSLYEAYTNLGGNSYIHSIYEDMLGWEVK